MGLDMYLVAKNEYVSGWDHSRSPMFDRLIKATGITPTRDSPSFSVSATVGYWRKANAVHAWFVKHVQNDVDDCGDYEVTREQLAALRDACRQVVGCVETIQGEVSTGTTYKPGGIVEHHTEPGRIVTNSGMAAAVLPTQRGCFFGKTDYDEHYLQDLTETAEMIDGLLSNKTLDGWDFYYHSSW